MKSLHERAGLPQTLLYIIINIYNFVKQFNVLFLDYIVLGSFRTQDLSKNGLVGTNRYRILQSLCTYSKNTSENASICKGFLA